MINDKKISIIIGIWVCEPDITFSISHVVVQYIKEMIIDIVLVPAGVYKQDADEFLNIVISFSESTVEPRLNGPEIDRANSFISYGFWLTPDILYGESSLDSFVTQFLDLFEQLIIQLGISNKNMDKLRMNIKNEVLYNPKYKYRQSYVSPDIDDILDELNL